ncbi:MAG TPA: hypothetical protein VMU12_02940 [Candidatus Paceibacterota bacterium]|nr:hypothetical protein [Candidatus Paceibacterota bacterium]
MASLFSSDKRLLVALPDIGFAQLVDLDLTVQYDGTVYHMLVRGSVDGGLPVIVPGTGSRPQHVWGGLTAYATSANISNGLGLPKGAIDIIQHALEEDFAPRLRSWLRDTTSRICNPEPGQKPAPLVKVDGNVLVQLDRDVSGIFFQKENTFRLEYTLFCEPKVFRCLLACHRGDQVKVLDFQKKSVGEIIRHLNDDALAFEIASYFGDTGSYKVHLVSSVLKLGFAMNTRPTTLVMATPEPKPKIAVAPVPSTPVMIFNGGTYFPLRG